MARSESEMLRLRELGLMIAVSSSRYAESHSAEEALLLGKRSQWKEGEYGRKRGGKGLKKVLSSRGQQLERRGWMLVVRQYGSTAALHSPPTPSTKHDMRGAAIICLVKYVSYVRYVSCMMYRTCHLSSVICHSSFVIPHVSPAGAGD